MSDVLTDPICNDSPAWGSATKRPIYFGSVQTRDFYKHHCAPTAPEYRIYDPTTSEWAANHAVMMAEDPTWDTWFRNQGNDEDQTVVQFRRDRVDLDGP